MPLYAPLDGQPVHRRNLPSGGYVAIEAQEVRALFAGRVLRGHVLVERRSEERRVGHRPPLVAVAERENLDDLLAALLPIAQDDTAITNALSGRVTIPITRRRETLEN